MNSESNTTPPTRKQRKPASDRPIVLFEEEIRGVFMASVAQAGGQAQWARANGISPSIVSEIMAGNKAVGNIVATALGFELINGYVPIARMAPETPT